MSGRYPVLDLRMPRGRKYGERCDFESNVSPVNREVGENFGKGGGIILQTALFKHHNTHGRELFGKRSQTKIDITMNRNLLF